MSKNINLSKEILVSICCQTYNHKDYIKQTLDSFLMQKTDFAYEILLRDDASTDGTAEICEEYAAQHPELINLLSYDENQYQKGVKPFSDNVKRAKGKYIAICEGDDYWTDPNKLQKQVDFLETNPDYVMCYHKVFSKIGDTMREDKLHRKPDEDLLTLANNITIPTLSVLFKKIDFADYFKYSDRIKGSYFLFILLAQYGKVRYIDELMGVYRVHQGGIWSGISSYKQADMKISNKELMIDYFNQRKDITRILVKSHNKICLRQSVIFLRTKQYKWAKKMFKRSFKYGTQFYHLYFMGDLIIDYITKPKL